MTPCVGQPVSWMHLERYGLGELPAAEHAAIREHLAVCPACGACYARIDVARELPALPLLAAKRRRAPERRVALFAGALGVLSAAAAALLFFVRVQPSSALPGPRLRAKGGEFALELVRVASDGRQLSAAQFAPGDRWKVLLTCPPPWVGNADVVAYQAGAAYFPLEPQVIESCGNRRNLAGAFQLDGATPVTLCVAFGPSTAVSRARLAEGPRALPELSVCERIEPAPASGPR